ncbi:MAG: SRPBCC family protein [Bacteroidota bacterium]
MLIKLTETINAQPEKVFEIMTNTRLLKKWMLDLTQVKETSGSRSKPGHQSILIFGKGEGALEVEETIIEFNKPKQLKLDLASRNMKSQQTFQFEALPDQKTRINARIKVNLRPAIINLFILFLRPSIRNQQRGDLKRLKRLIEERN